MHMKWNIIIMESQIFPRKKYTFYHDVCGRRFSRVYRVACMLRSEMTIPSWEWIFFFVEMTPKHMNEKRVAFRVLYFFAHSVNISFLIQFNVVFWPFVVWHNNSTVSVFCTNGTGFFSFLTSHHTYAKQQKKMFLFVKHFTFTNAYKLARKFEFAIVIVIPHVHNSPEKCFFCHSGA